MSEEQLLKVVVDNTTDIEKLHAKVAIIETKYIAMFAAVKSSFEKAGIPFELDETYLNELLDGFYADVPFATEAQVNGDLTAADHERMKAEQAAVDAAAEALAKEPKVRENSGEVAIFTNGLEISRQRPASWPRGFTQTRVHQALPISATVMPWHVFKEIFSVGSAISEVQERLIPATINPGVTQRYQNPGAAQDGAPKEAKK